MIEWTEETAIKAIRDDGGDIEGRAIKDPSRLTGRSLSAMDYLINWHRYYRRSL